MSIVEREQVTCPVCDSDDVVREESIEVYRFTNGFNKEGEVVVLLEEQHWDDSSVPDTEHLLCCSCMNKWKHEKGYDYR